MIRPIDIKLNAAHPELPLLEAVTFTGSPSTVLIRGVPPNCGRWAITAVFVAASFPDGSTTTHAAVQSANGVWVATLPATATSGRTANGIRVMADGIDENGEAVTGYILGVADFAVASLDVTPAPQPGETSYQMLYFDTAPSVLHKGDVTKIDGVPKFYNGTAWEPFAAPVTFDNAVTRTSTNGVKSSGIWSAIWGALSALPTGFASLYDWCVSQLAGKASKSDATLTERGPDKDGFSAWTIFREGVDVTAQITEMPHWIEDVGWVVIDSHVSGDLAVQDVVAAGQDALSLEWACFRAGDLVYTATRTALPGYQLGSQTDKPLASEAEAEALRTGKANRAANPTAGNLAALDSSGNPTNALIPAANVALKGEIPYSLGDATIIDSSSVQTDTSDPSNPIDYAEVTLVNRTSNGILVSVAIDELRVVIPAKTNGKVRDFGLVVLVDTAIAAPALVPIAPTGESILLFNSEGEMPELADGTVADGGRSILYFSEIVQGSFLVKGEQMQEVV